MNEQELISFGNYLLSDKRKKRLIKKVNAKSVTHADLENWKHEQLAKTSQHKSI